MNVVAVLLAVLGQVVFSFVDPTIEESSGLVDLGATMVTTNDSGGDPLVFVVDARTGRTVGRTTFADETVDVEALAPAGSDAVWVGDIGDNAERRESVQVYRVPVGRGDRKVSAPAYELVYPDGPHDAESLVAARNGRLYVVTKGILGGRAFAAPRHLRADRPNRLTAVARVGTWATDAALFPDGRHVLVRGYDDAVVLTFPDFRPVGSFDLPRQRQGEGVSIGSSGRIRLSSEGRNSPVLQVELPAELRAALEPSGSSSSTTPAEPEAAPAPVAADAGSDGGVSPQVLAGGTLVVLAGVGLGLWIRRRRRHP